MHSLWRLGRSWWEWKVEDDGVIVDWGELCWHCNKNIELQIEQNEALLKLLFWPFHGTQCSIMPIRLLCFDSLSHACVPVCHLTRSTHFSRGWLVSVKIMVIFDQETGTIPFTFPSRIDATSRWVWVIDECVACAPVAARVSNGKVSKIRILHIYLICVLLLRRVSHSTSFRLLGLFRRMIDSKIYVFHREQSRQIWYERNNADMCNIITI